MSRSKPNRRQRAARRKAKAAAATLTSHWDRGVLAPDDPEVVVDRLLEERAMEDRGREDEWDGYADELYD